MKSSWLQEGRQQHTRTMITITFVIATSGPWLQRLPSYLQTAGLVLLVALFGIPHGALDHWVGRRVLKPRFGTFWSIPFLALYLGIGGAVILSWIVSPVLTLILFLVVSAIHFGREDVQASRGSQKPTSFEVGLRGSLPIVLAIGLYPEETTKLFLWMVPHAAPQDLYLLTLTISALLPIWMFGFFIHVLSTFLRWAFAQRVQDRDAGLELLTLMFLFTACPPLVSFVVYFCGWHATRHTLELAAGLEPHHKTKAFRSFLLHSVPLTLATVALAGVGWWWLSHYQAVTQVGIQVVFIGLSALTFPHMAFQWMVQKDEATTADIEPSNTTLATVPDP